MPLGHIGEIDDRIGLATFLTSQAAEHYGYNNPIGWRPHEYEVSNEQH